MLEARVHIIHIGTVWSARHDLVDDDDGAGLSIYHGHRLRYNDTTHYIRNTYPVGGLNLYAQIRIRARPASFIYYCVYALSIRRTQSADSSFRRIYLLWTTQKRCDNETRNFRCHLLPPLKRTENPLRFKVISPRHLCAMFRSTIPI